MRFTLRLSALTCLALACVGALLSASRSARAQTPAVQAGQVIISELRYRGPNGIRDEFIELYNNTDSDIIVQAADATAGWAVFTSNGSITGPVCLIPNNTRIPARGHLLCANTDPDFNSGYSLNGYPSGNPTPQPTPTPNFFAQTTPDRTFVIDDLPDGFGVALFKTQSSTNLNSGTRLDSFGFTNSPELFKEGNGFPLIPTANNEHTLFRDLRPVTPLDSGNNATDFRFVATTATLQTSLNGSPGPENLASPIVNNNISSNVIDPAVGAASPPNRVRIHTAETNAPQGTILIRRLFTNNTGRPVSRLRFRVTNITTRGTPASECGGSPCADVRALTSQDESVTLSNSTKVTVQGVRLEADPPLTPEGGGLNASLSADFITLAQPLADGASVRIQFKLGVVQTGPFRFFVNIEAQNSPTAVVVTSPARVASSKR